MKHGISILLIMLLLLAPLQSAGATDDAFTVRTLVEKFISEEFNGNGCARDDDNVVKYDKATQSIYENNLNGACVYLNAFPVEIVGKIEVINTEVKKNRGKVTVAFRRLGKTSGIGFYKRIIIPDPVERDLVDYGLVKKKGRWFIYNPPIFHISKKAFSDYYIGTVKANDAIKDHPLITEDQKEYFKINRTTYEAIMALPE